MMRAMRTTLTAVLGATLLLSGCGGGKSGAPSNAAPAVAPTVQQSAAVASPEAVPAAPTISAQAPAMPTPTPRVVTGVVEIPAPTPAAPAGATPTPKPKPTLKPVATPKPTPTPVPTPNHPVPSGPDGTTCPPGYHYHQGRTASDPYVCATGGGGDVTNGLPGNWCDHAGEGATGTDMMFQEEECRVGPDGHLEWEHPAIPTPTP